MIRVDPRSPRGILWIASYPRSGNTWMRVFLYCLRKSLSGEPLQVPLLADLRNYEASDVELPLYERLAGRALDPMSPAIARLRPKVQMEIARTSKGIVTVKTHNAILSHRGFPLINPQATAGAIYLVKSPLDIVVSYAELRGRAIDVTIDQMAASGFAGWAQGVAYWASGSWTENVKSWTGRRTRSFWSCVTRTRSASPSRHSVQSLVTFRLNPTAAQLGAAIEMASFGRLQSAEREQGFAEVRKRLEPSFGRGVSVSGATGLRVICPGSSRHTRKWSRNSAICLTDIHSLVSDDGGLDGKSPDPILRVTSPDK